MGGKTGKQVTRGLLIKGGSVIRGGRIEREDVVISAGRIERIGELDIDGNQQLQNAEIINAKGMYVTPGFIDLQVNGGNGYAFMDAGEKAVCEIASFHASHGTTSLMATIITAPPEQIRSAMEAVRRSRQRNIIGVHLEGPFISRERRGAHNPRYIRRPSPKLFQELTEGFEGFVKMVTIAPELPGAPELIEAIKDLNAVPALGHSNATYEETLRATDQGVKYFTHLFNAMRIFHHRQPGAVGAALEHEDVITGLIVDGVHLHPAVIRLILKLKRVDYICLVSDATSAVGMHNGKYYLGDLEVYIREGALRLSDGTLAGSLLTMDQALRNLIAFTGIELPEAIRTVSETPAKVLDLFSHKGSLEVGKDADIVLLSEGLEVQYTIIAGKIVYARSKDATPNHQ